MCGLLIKRSTGKCPNCKAEFWVKAGLFADDRRYLCEICGARMILKTKWGRLVSVKRGPGFRGLPPVGSPLRFPDLSKSDGESYKEDWYDG